LRRACGAEWRAVVIVLRRIVLLFALLVVPLVLAVFLYEASLYALAVSDRAIDPNILHYSAVVEYAAFLSVTIVEVRDRW